MLKYLQHFYGGQEHFTNTLNTIAENICRSDVEMIWLLILSFAISSSLDNLGVGISYGIRNIRIGLLANSIIAITCFLFSETGILFGVWISKILPGIFPIIVAAFLLLVIGIRIILIAIPRKQANKSEADVESTHPTATQLKGGISLWEACILGIALSANALTNGLSAGLLGLPSIAISITAAIGSFITVWLGVTLGRKVAMVRIGSFTLGQFGTLVSGAILIVIAINTLF
ncbi:manganese efflux pump [Microbacteriaceae bacterium 4G12]